MSCASETMLKLNTSVALVMVTSGFHYLNEIRQTTPCRRAKKEGGGKKKSCPRSHMSSTVEDDVTWPITTWRPVRRRDGQSGGTEQQRWSETNLDHNCRKRFTGNRFCVHNILGRQIPYSLHVKVNT